MGNYYADPVGNIITDTEELDQIKTFNLWDKYLAEPFRNWLDLKVTGMKTNIMDWLKVSGIDLIELIAIVIIISIALKMLLIGKKEKDGSIIYTTFISYIVIKLFWRVILHA